MISIKDPFSFMIFGASGHLAKIKLYPALYVLAAKKRLPKKFNIVGYSRSKFSQSEFHKRITDAVIAKHPNADTEILNELLQHCHYVSGQYDSEEDFKRLAAMVTELEGDWTEDSVRLGYFAVPPSVFGAISKNLCAGRVHRVGQKHKHFRCIVEKPIGSDFKTFKKIQKDLLGCFQPEEIFLLDHALGKDAVRNVYYLRVANPILETLLENSILHSVQISALESAGIGNRAGFYDSTGAFRDMFQSHLLMLMAMLTMERSNSELQTVLSDALQKAYLPPVADMDSLVLQGQYKGYTDENNVDDDSTTNTYACMKLMSRMANWEGVPFYLRSGKSLSKKETRISLRFFEKEHCSSKGCTFNHLDIILQGEAGMNINLLTRISGTEDQYRPLVLSDPLESTGDALPEHAVLLAEAISYKQDWFLNFEDVATSWRLLDPVQDHLDKVDTPLHMYQPGTNGPVEADRWLENHGDQWRD